MTNNTENKTGSDCPSTPCSASLPEGFETLCDEARGLAISALHGELNNIMPPNYVTESADPLAQEEVQKANHYWRNEYESLVKKITEKSEQPNRFAMNGWSFGKPTIDGTYLRAFDESDTDADGEIYHVIGGSWYKDGEPRVCYGGVWKRIGDLPRLITKAPETLKALQRAFDALVKARDCGCEVSLDDDIEAARKSLNQNADVHGPRP